MTTTPGPPLAAQILSAPRLALRVLLTLPKRYERLVLLNAEQLATWESGLRAMLFMAPMRFQNSDVVSEAGYSVVSLLSFYHDVIIIRFLMRHPRLGPIVRRKLPQPHLLPAVKVLAFLGYMELAAEMLSRHRWGSAGRWRVVAGVEILKVMVRLWMLIRQRGSMLSCQSIPARDVLVSEEDPATPDGSTPTGSPSPLPRRPSATMLMAPTDLRPTPASGLLVVGELLWICRPLVYLALLFRYGGRSWRPWLVSLLIDILSRQCSSWSSAAASFNEREKDELARRSVLWIFYLLRRPMAVDSLRRLPHVPLLSSLLDGVANYYDFLQNYYFYTAATSL